MPSYPPPSHRRSHHAATARGQRDRRVWVFSQLNQNLRPEQVAEIITRAGLEQARLEAEAKAAAEALRLDGKGEEGTDHG